MPGDLTLEQQMLNNRSSFTDLENERYRLLRLESRTAADNSRLNFLEKELIPTAYNNFITSKTNWKNSFPSGETPKITLISYDPSSTSNEAHSTDSVKDRTLLRQQYQETTTQINEKKERANILEDKITAGTATSSEQNEYNNLINTEIPNLQTQATSQRQQYNTSTNELTTSNETMIENNKLPLLDDGNTADQTTGEVTDLPKTFSADLDSSAGTGNTQNFNTTLYSNTNTELHEDRKTQYIRINNYISSLQQENSTLQSELEKKEQLLQTQKDTGTETQFTENEINSLQQRINQNHNNINEKENLRNQMQINDAQREFVQNNEIRNEADNRVAEKGNNRRQAVKDLNKAERKFQREGTDESLAELEQARLDLNVAEKEYDDALANREHVSKLRTDPDYFKQNYIQNQDGAWSNGNPNYTVILDTPVEPEYPKYGVVTQEDKDRWVENPDESPSEIYDTETGNKITLQEMELYEDADVDAGRFVVNRPGIDDDELQKDAAEQINLINTIEQNQVSEENLRYSEDLENTTAIFNSDATVIQANSDIKSDQNDLDSLNKNKTELELYINSNGEVWPENSEGTRPENVNEAIEKLSITQNEIDDKERNIQTNEELIESKRSELFDPINEEHETNLESISITNNTARQQVLSISSSERQSATEPVTVEEAKGLLSQRDVAKENEGINRSRFEQQRQIAINNCQSIGGSNCEDPSNWSSEDYNNVESQYDSWQGSREDLQNANESIAIASTAPNGESSLLQAGASNEEILAAQESLTEDPVGRVDAAIHSGNKADAIKNINTGIKPTGFENVNNSAPFYLQYPTLNSITDFRMKNGFSPYGTRSNDAIARDAVHFNVFELNPPSATAETNADGTLVRNVVSNSSSNLLGTYTIYPNNPDWLTMDHNHTWGNEQLSNIANMANTALGAVDTVQSLLTLFNNVSDSAQIGSEQSIAQRIQRRIDTVDTYQSTDRLQITIPFILFTKKDFLRDVFRPLMLLTAMTYPKRLLGGNLGRDLQKASKQISKLVGDLPDGAIKSALNNVSNIANEYSGKVGNVIDSGEQSLSSAAGYGPFRYYVSKRPEYLSMRHASGLMYFPLCYITNINYEFKGPWYNFDGKPLNDPSKYSQLDKILRSEIINKNNIDIFNNPNSKKLFYAYPSMAEVKITVRNALPFYRDDWMELFYGAGLGGQDLVNVTVNQTTQGNLITPTGDTLRPPVGLNNSDLFSNTTNTSITPKGGVSAKSATNSSVNNRNT